MAQLNSNHIRSGLPIFGQTKAGLDEKQPCWVQPGFKTVALYIAGDHGTADFGGCHLETNIHVYDNYRSTYRSYLSKPLKVDDIFCVLKINGYLIIMFV